MKLFRLYLPPVLLDLFWFLFTDYYTVLFATFFSFAFNDMLSSG